VIYALALAGWCLFAGTLTFFATGRISQRTFYALTAVSNGVEVICSVARHLHGAAGFEAALAAMCMWLWWQDGGGDDTKRRLRSWARKFHGVRRTAPATG
jgi:hypothetical protein